MIRHERLGDILVENEFVCEEDINHCLEKQKELNKPLGKILLEQGLITEEQLTRSLAQQLGFTFVNLRQVPVSEEALNTIPEEIAKHYQVLPLSIRNEVLTVAISDPLNLTAIDDLSLLTNHIIQVVVASKQDIEWGINRYYLPQKDSGDTDSTDETERNSPELNEANDGPTISYVESIISKAVVMGASDIHIEPHEKEVVVRFRIDGILYDIMDVPHHLRDSVTSRLKVMAKLNITEKRKPQDGSFHMNIMDRNLDVRMSTISTFFGEKVVLRLLDKKNVLKMEDLGFSQNNLNKVKQMIESPHGIILVTGPTGSGKTTTLYAILNELNQADKNIVTIEDPVEYVLPRINQTQINPRAGITFSSSLRSILRQDPDIIMVGEIRDDETAKIAVQAALTGHLVLSTLHTNTALGSLQRLINMGIDPYLIASSIKGLMAQRLVRKVCQHCKRKVQVEPEVIKRNFNMEKIPQNLVFYKGEGCIHCQHSGYRGRLGVHEVIITDELLISLINQGATENEIKEKLHQNNRYLTLADDCLLKMNAGLTTLEEVLQVIYH